METHPETGPFPFVLLTRAQQDWAYEFHDRTGPDTQVCQIGSAGVTGSKKLSYRLIFIMVLHPYVLLCVSADGLILLQTVLNSK